MSTDLSEHFTLAAMVASKTATELSIDNTPSDEIVENLRLAAAGMELVRALLGDHPIRVNSGYRCPALNAAIPGSAKNSAHMQGYAVDFVCPEYGSPLDIVKAILASGIKFDKCIQEGTWVHISFDPQERREIMTAHFQSGKDPTYTAGA